MKSSGDWTGELHKLLNGVTNLNDAPTIGKGFSRFSYKGRTIIVRSLTRRRSVVPGGTSRVKKA